MSGEVRMTRRRARELADLERSKNDISRRYNFTLVHVQVMILSITSAEYDLKPVLQHGSEVITYSNTFYF